MKRSYVILAAVMSACLTACFNSKPTESDAKDLVVKVYKKYLEAGDLVLESVKKTDGKEVTIFGNLVYAMDVDITFKFPRGIHCAKFSTLTYVEMRTCGILRIKEDIAPGQSKTTQRQIGFSKSEKGWSGDFAN